MLAIHPLGDAVSAKPTSLPWSFLPARILFPVLTLFLALFFPVWADAADEEIRNPYWAVPVDLPPTQNLYRVTQDIYRSAQPDKEAMEQLEKLGIRTVLNLRDNHDDNDEAKDTHLHLERVGMTTWSIKEEEVLRALVILRAAEKPLLVHCMHGADRTGLVMAVYRMVEQSWSKEAALDEMQNGGYGFHTIWMNIPRFIKKMDVQAFRNKLDAMILPSPVTTLPTTAGTDSTVPETGAAR